MIMGWIYYRLLNRIHFNIRIKPYTIPELSTILWRRNQEQFKYSSNLLGTLPGRWWCLLRYMVHNLFFFREIIPPLSFMFFYLRWPSLNSHKSFYLISVSFTVYEFIKWVLESIWFLLIGLRGRLRCQNTFML